MDPAEARDLWHLLETVHAVTYFEPSCREANEALGFRGFWMGYFGTRSAPMGRVEGGTVGAVFAGFHPHLVHRALPDAWDLCEPARAVTGRADAAAAALRQVDLPVEPLAEDLLDDLEVVVAAADPTGRPLFAANAEVDPFEDPVAELWQLCTSLREHRGDGHVATLVAEGLTGVEAHHLAVAAGSTDGDVLRQARGFDEQEWRAGAATLVAAGLLADGKLTDAGRALRDRIEARTDELAATPYTALGQSGRERLRDSLIPLAAAVVERGVLPFPNPIGLPQVV